MPPRLQSHTYTEVRPYPPVSWISFHYRRVIDPNHRGGLHGHDQIACAFQIEISLGIEHPWGDERFWFDKTTMALNVEHLRSRTDAGFRLPTFRPGTERFGGEMGGDISAGAVPEGPSE